MVLAQVSPLLLRVPHCKTGMDVMDVKAAIAQELEQVLPTESCRFQVDSRYCGPLRASSSRMPKCGLLVEFEVGVLLILFTPLMFS